MVDMTTWYVTRPESGKAKQVLTYGFEGEWLLAEGSTVLARARSHQTSNKFEIDANGRRYVADMPGLKAVGQEKAFTVDDEATGQRLVDATRLTEAEPDAAPTRERWSVGYVGGPTLAWVFNQDPPEIGFYDNDGNALVTYGHDVPLDLTSKGGGTLRMLFRMWLGVAKAMESYAVHVDEERVAASAPGVDPRFLALLGMWLCRRWDLKSRSQIGYTA
jgi:hypothetical protein